MTNSELRVVHSIACLDGSAGGPVRSVMGLCSGLALAGCETHLVYLDSGDNKDAILQETPGVELHPVRAAGRGRLSQCSSGRLFCEVKKILGCRKVDAVQDHGIWLPSNVATSLAADRVGVPRIVSPHGTLAKWALEFKPLRKRMAWSAYQHRLLQGARVIRATSFAEYRDVRAAGLTRPVAVIANGVSIEFARCSDSKYGAPKRTAAFLGRLHPVKGLINLIRAWGAVRPSGWRLILAGPAEVGHDREITALIQEMGLGNEVELIGEVSESSKWKLLAEVELLVLPSFTENFGMVVAEALASGVPVITTKGTPWEEVTKHECGWWVEANEIEIGQALREATSSGFERLRQMGQRGVSLIQERYLWRSVSAQMMELYLWIKNGGKAPSFLLFD